MVAIERPTVRDIDAMLHLMEPHMLTERLLPRSAQQVCESLRDYVVARDGEQIVGLGSIRLVDSDLAELGALAAIDDSTQRSVMEALLSEAKELGVGKAFVLTDEAATFEAWGFQRCSLADLPQKRDRQCLRCPRLPRCRQVALQIALDEAS